MKTIPCPVCKSTQTLEQMARDALALAQQAEPERHKHAIADIERGIVNYGPPPGPDQLEPLRTRVALIHQELEGVHRFIDSVVTCADCGVLYRPRTPGMRAQLDSLMASLQKRYLLDAMARETGRQ